MASLFHSTYNTRPLREGSLRYLRSDVPDRLNDEEVRWLERHGVTTIVDLRTPEEVSSRPCLWAQKKPFEYRNLPVTGGNAVPASPVAVVNSYLDMVDGNMERILEILEGTESNVLYFCMAGKDRTGVVSALLLSRMGASREEIVADYGKSADNLRELLQTVCRLHPELDPEVLEPRKETMEKFLDALGKKFCK